MDALKGFSLVAMAALLAAGVAPAFAQDTRDTRPRPERPVVEPDKGGSDDEAEPDRRLPKSSPGISCILDQAGDGLDAEVVNNTGKTIPAGTVLTLHIQPGNIQKLFKLDADWAPGVKFGVALADGSVELPAFCAVKLSAARAEPKDNDTNGSPFAVPDKARKTPPTYVPFKPGDIPALEQDFPLNGEYGFTCEVVAGGTLITNTGNMTITAQSRLTWYVPGSHSSSWYVWDDIAPGESVFLPNPPDMPADALTRIGSLCKVQKVEPPKQP